ncbi:MAG: hypothetical protein IKJ48_00135, partial [Alistipes sp.]|nr:hypothetical protein [Alistipes sp.]
LIQGANVQKNIKPPKLMRKFRAFSQNLLTLHLPKTIIRGFLSIFQALRGLLVMARMDYAAERYCFDLCAAARVARCCLPD